MKTKKEIRQLKKEIRALKKIIKSNSITLTNPANPQEQIVLEYENSKFTTVHKVANVNAVEKELNVINTSPTN